MKKEIKQFLVKLLILSVAFVAVVPLTLTTFDAMTPKAKADLPSSVVACFANGGQWDWTNWYCIYPPNTVPGSGGDGWPPQCDATMMQFYYLGVAIMGYVDPDWFYATYGCYPY